MNCQKGGCSCKQTQPNSTNFFFCPGPLATFCWPNLPIKIDIFSMDFDPNLEENYHRLQKLLVLVGSWAFNPTRLRFKAQAKQHQKGGGASNLWTRKVASPSLSLFFSIFILYVIDPRIFLRLQPFPVQEAFKDVETVYWFISNWTGIVVNTVMI